MESLIAPQALQKGDKVAIVALASKLNPDGIQPAIQLMKDNWGLEVIIGESVSASYYGFAGTDKIRTQDFQKMLDDSSVKAIFSARGGYGSSRIIDNIDFTVFRQSPKWVVGFSDITAVHSHIQSLGFQSLHAPMPKTFMKDNYSLETLHAFLFGENKKYEVSGDELDRIGVTQGQIIGGNLCLLAHLVGSQSDINWDDKILFIEDIGEYLYNIDRMMVQLKRVGKLRNLQGLIVGSFTDSKENDEPFGKTAYEIIAEHVSEYNYPVCFGFPTGHDNANWAIPCGRVANLKVNTSKTVLTFQ
ncbi:LD-carboxypeptidase [Emticicia sp. BO119]|uniref:S66 peptidase family protein n=1 Tax=Emticicia sp. BO119 TaxID=2757768 RepID=UPI0015F0EECF|nr:LD-carboxypeptidase [Emticicia sp. BO119]MBA4853133.1 LD-carboxypeptidase [Emticicia sp. BO119]